MGILGVYRSDASLPEVEDALAIAFGMGVGSSLEGGQANLFLNLTVEGESVTYRNGQTAVTLPLREVRKALAKIGVTQLEY